MSASVLTVLQLRLKKVCRILTFRNISLLVRGRQRFKAWFWLLPHQVAHSQENFCSPIFWLYSRGRKTENEQAIFNTETWETTVFDCRIFATTNGPNREHDCSNMRQVFLSRTTRGRAESRNMWPYTNSYYFYCNFMYRYGKNFGACFMNILRIHSSIRGVL